MNQTATNPQTGERVVLIDGAWTPFTPSATNPEGAKAYLTQAGWQVVEPGRDALAVLDGQPSNEPIPQDDRNLLQKGKDAVSGFFNEMVEQDVLPSTRGGAGFGEAVVDATAGFARDMIDESTVQHQRRPCSVHASWN